MFHTNVQPTWVIVGASRGIGLEFVRQLLARGDRVLATVRDVDRASGLWSLAGAPNGGACQLFECDIRSDQSISVSQGIKQMFKFLIFDTFRIL